MTEDTNATIDPDKPEQSAIGVKSSATGLSTTEYLYRKRIVMVAVPGLVGLLLVLLPSEIWYFFRVGPNPELGRIFIGFAAATSFGISAVGVITFYLQTGFKRDFRQGERLTTKGGRSEETSTDPSCAINKTVASAVHDVQTRVSRLENERRDSAILTEPDRQALISDLASKLRTEASTDLLNSLQAKAQELVAQRTHHDMIEEQFAVSAGRLNGELGALGRRGNLNLALGIVTTIVGLSLLGYFVVKTSLQPEQLPTFAIHFIPRISLVIFVEVFAYFFLKLYKATLSEIKYFQNELTNIEGKFMAVKAAFAVGDSKVIELVIKNLVLTERNYLLKKGETTVQLEQQKRDTELAAEIGKHITDAVKAAVKH